MSIIRVQASRHTIANYAGTLLAAISTLLIYPIDDFEGYGLGQFLLAISMLVLPFVTAGSVSVVVKFFADYKERGEHRSYLFNVLLLAFSISVVALGLAWLVDKPIILFLEAIGFDVKLVLRYKYHIGLLTLVLLYNRLLALHASNYERIVIPSIWQNIWPKFVLPVLVLLKYYGIISFEQLATYWVLSFLVISVGLTLYLISLGGFDVMPRNTFFHRQRFREVMRYAAFVGFSVIGTVIVNRLDIIMLGMLLGVSETGLYTVTLFIAGVLTIPSKGILQIASPIIATEFSRGGNDRIEDIYKKSSINLLIVAVPLFFGLLGTLPAVLSVSPKYNEYIDIVILLFAILGTEKLISILFSVNQQIIMYSDKYKYVAAFVIIMAVLNALLNYYWINSMGIAGAAWSTFVSLTIYNVIKVVFVRQAFGMHPFSRDTLSMLLIIGACTLFYFLLPSVGNLYADALIYGTGLVVLYTSMVLLLKIESPIVDSVLGIVKRGVKK